MKNIKAGILVRQIKEKVHSKFASAEDHTIIDIKDIGKHQEEQKLDFTQLKCTEHAGQNCCLFCKPCDQLVCPVCVAKTHKKHDLLEIKEGFTIKVEKIKDKQKMIHKRIKSLSKGKNELQKIQFMGKSSFENSKQGILNQESELIKAVKKHSKKLLNELDQEKDDISKSVLKEQSVVEKSKEALEQRNEEVNDLLQSNNPKRIFTETLTSTVIDIKPVNTRFNPVPKFVPGDVTKIPSLFGELEPIPYNTNLQIVQTIQTDMVNADDIVVCPDTSLWIGDNIECLHKIHIKQDSMRYISKLQLYVKNMALTQSGDLLLSVIGSSVIKVIPSGTEKVTDSPYNVSPVQPLGIHVTQDNTIIIGARDKGPAFPATGPRQVIILDKSGRQENVFQYDKDNKALYTCPIRVTSTSNNNIGVVDMLSEDYKGRIVILNSEGQVINIYTGQSDVNNEDNPFKPSDITATPSDNCIIADFDNHTLHILSCNGEMITYYNTKKLGIVFPSSLSFSQTGMLYIGCGTYTDRFENAKIYKLDNFVWL